MTRSGWLRFQHDFFECPHFYELTSEERLAWIYILCERSRRETDDFFTVNTQHFHRVTGMNTTVCMSTIKKLHKEQVLEIRTLRGRYVDVTRTCSTVRNERTNETERNETDATTCSDPVASDRYRAVAGLESLQDVFNSRQIKSDLQRTWIEAYPDPIWVTETVRKALAWEAANPARKKINFGRFITAWLARDWDRRLVPSRRGEAQPLDPKKIFGGDYVPESS